MAPDDLLTALERLKRLDAANNYATFAVPNKTILLRIRHVLDVERAALWKAIANGLG